MNYVFILAIFPTSFLPFILYPYLPKILYSYLPFTLLRHIAAYLDIDQSILSKIEHNERKPSKENIIKLAEILKIDRQYLMVQYISDRILSEFAGEPCLSEAIKVTAKKASLINNKNSGK